MKADIGKIVYDLKEGRCGNFVRISDYTVFEKEVVTQGERKAKNKFYSSQIFCNELVGNLWKKFWRVIPNFQCLFTKEDIEEHFDVKIYELEQELEYWQRAKKNTLQKADEYLKEFNDLQKSTNYFDYE